MKKGQLVVLAMVVVLLTFSSSALAETAWESEKFPNGERYNLSFPIKGVFCHIVVFDNGQVEVRAYNISWLQNGEVYMVTQFARIAPDLECIVFLTKVGAKLETGIEGGYDIIAIDIKPHINSLPEHAQKKLLAFWPNIDY